MTISIVFSFSLNAQVFIKENPNGSGNGSSWSNAAGASDLESAIDQGGTIYVAAGTYTFSQTVRLGENVSIIGGYPANASGTDLSGYNPATNLTILDGDGGNVSNKSAFEVVGEFDATNVTIRGIQFQNWRGTSGAVFGAWSRVINPVYYTFDECSFINNVGNVGVIHLSLLGNPQNQIYITNCNFVNNVGYNSSNLAGAIYLNAVYRQSNTFQPVTGNLVISDNSFVGNTAQTGGAIWASQAFGWNISNNCFSNNLANSAGGACLFSSMSSTIFNGNQFFSNFVSGGDGGAMYAQSVNFIEFNDNIFTNNSAWTYGGALRLVTTSLQGTNNEYSDNTSGLANPVYNGGAIFHVLPYNSTVTSNLTTSIFHNNTPDHVQLNTNSMFNLGPGNQFDPVGFTPTPAVTCPAPFISCPDSCTVNNTNISQYEAFAIWNTSTTNARLYGFTSLSTAPTLIASDIANGYDVNHLATDFTRDRVLFAGNEGLQDLLAYDFATNSVINVGPFLLSSLGFSSGGASFYAGDYYIFDDNGNNSSEVGLYKVTFDANGNAATLTEIAEVAFNSQVTSSLPVGQGDIAIDTDGTLYALESYLLGTSADGQLWKLDVNATNPTWTLVGNPFLAGTSQIFIANDGRLIANNGPGDFVELSKTTGQIIDNTFDTSGSTVSWDDISEGGQVISCPEDTNPPNPNCCLTKAPRLLGLGKK